METLQVFQTCAINLSRASLALVAKFGRSVFERRLGVAVAVAAIGPGELPINVDGDASLTRSRARIISRENARGSRSNDKSLCFGEKPKGDAKRLVQWGKERNFAIQRIDEYPAKAGGGEREKMAASHARQCSKIDGG